MMQTGLPDPDPTEVDELVRRIEACPIPRRKPRAERSVCAQLSPDDPLRHQITGASGAYLVRRLLHTLGFDEHRAMQWRMEHKLVQASVFQPYVPGALAGSWGFGALVRVAGPPP